MNGKQLKNSILQWAIQGKLVPQDPNDEPASVLLEKIRAEKARLVKEGKLKKKDLEVKPIAEDEIPFEIPKGWEWCRLKELVFNHGQKVPDKKFSYIDIGSIDNKKQKLNEKETLIEAKEAPSRARRIVCLNDIVYSTVRPYLHNMAIINKAFVAEPIASTGFAVLSCHDGLFNKYLFYYLMSPDFDEYANNGDNAKGVAYPAINDEKLYKALVPLPPLAEQHRIVAKIEELMPLVEKYGAAQETLDEWNQALPEKLKKSILQEAIQGKLVPQDPADEPAIISSNHKIPKKISSFDDYLFEIPDNWKWSQLFQVADVIGGYAFQSGDLKSSTGVRVIRISDITPKGLSNKSVVRCSLKDVPNQYAIKSNDILIAMTGGTVGKSLLLGYMSEPMYLNQRVAMIRASKDIEIEYLNLIIKSPLIQSIISEVKNSTNDNISMADILGFPVPLPPLAEQRRIVAKIEELFGVI